MNEIIAIVIWISSIAVFSVYIKLFFKWLERRAQRR